MEEDRLLDLKEYIQEVTPEKELTVGCLAEASRAWAW